MEKKVLISNHNSYVSEKIRDLLQPADCISIILKDALCISSIETLSPINLIIVGDKITEDMTGIEYVKELRKWNNSVPIIFVTEESSETLAIQALKSGVTDYMQFNECSNEILKTIDKLLKIEAGLLKQRLESGSIIDEKIIGESVSIQSMKEYIRNIAKSESNVLITGETGTGKELIAEMIHMLSKRAKKDLICINCAAIPDNLFENELFGHERGAFTGAESVRNGLINTTGTLFLDEIGDMSLYAQAKILRVLETRKIQRLGGNQDIPINIRLIAATNKDLEQMTKIGQFRKDLYFRLNVARINVIPLRERKNDIPVLINHFISQFNRIFEKSVTGFTNSLIKIFMEYDWPGNVRELRNVIEGIFICKNGSTLTADDIPVHFRELFNNKITSSDERKILLCTLQNTCGNKKKAAELLNYSRMTLYRKIAKYGLEDYVRSPQQ